MPSKRPASSDPGASSEHLHALLRDVSRLLRERIDEELEPLGVSQAQWRPLLALHKAGEPLTQTELAKILEIEAPSVVRLLDRLSDKNLIERRSAPGDRRARHIFLTDSARQLVDRIMPLARRARDEAFGAASATEIDTCCAVLTKIRERIQSS